jgi:hypothetical protein
MTVVHQLRNRIRPVRVAGIVIVSVLTWITGESRLAADPPPVHYNHAGIMPPGAIGSQQLMRGGPLPGYFQPVEIKAPEGTQISPAVAGGFEEPSTGTLTAGLLIGAVYRLRVTNIPLQEGIEVYPTVEVIDRTYPPVGQEFKFPIPIELTQEELETAAEGRFVTRVIYIEDPESAVPVARKGNEQAYFEVQVGDNPLDVADSLGRPVAIMRMGARVPDAQGPDDAFLFGAPPLIRWNPRQPAAAMMQHAQAAVAAKDFAVRQAAAQMQKPKRRAVAR